MVALEGAKTALVNGASLTYQEQGNGEPVVLVHGSSSDLRTWEHQLRPLSTLFRVVAYSRRYAWPNEPIPEGADDPMPPHVDDLIAFLEQIGASPANLVGHSWGGFICLLAAIQHPEAVRSLVLMEPPVLPLFLSSTPRPHELFRTLLRWPRTAIAIMRFGMSAAGPAVRAYQRGDDEAGFEAFSRGVLGDETFERLSAERRAQALDNLATDKAQLLGVGFPPLNDDEVREVRHPVLLMHGQKSPAMLRLLMDRLEELLPQAERIEIPRASHIMHEDNPESVSETILTFLRRRADW